MLSFTSTVAKLLEVPVISDSIVSMCITLVELMRWHNYSRMDAMHTMYPCLSDAVQGYSCMQWTQGELPHAVMHLSIKYPPPGLMKGFDKGIDERPFPQGGAFDMTPFNLCGLKSSL